MYFQLTNAGAQRLKADPTTAPTYYLLGSAFNYVPSPTDTNIHGTQVSTKGGVSAANQVNGNVLRYSIALTSVLGPFAFGELGLFLADGTLFALGSNQNMMNKVIGQQFRMDAYINSTGTDYLAYLQVAETSNSYKMGVMQSVDTLPQGQDGNPQAYIIETGQTDTFRAFSSGTGLWNFDDFWPQDDTYSALSASSTSVTVAKSSYTGPLSADREHPVLIEFVSGYVWSTCRTVTSITDNGTSVTLSWTTPMVVTALAGEQLLLFKRRPRELLAGPGLLLVDNGRGSLTVALSTAYQIQSQLQFKTSNSKDQTVLTNTATKAYLLQQGLPGSVMYLVGVNNNAQSPQEQLTFSIQLDGTEIGTIVVPQYRDTGMIVFAQDQQVNVGQVLTLVLKQVTSLTLENFLGFVSLLGAST